MEPKRSGPLRRVRVRSNRCEVWSITLQIVRSDDLQSDSVVEAELTATGRTNILPRKQTTRNDRLVPPGSRFYDAAMQGGYGRLGPVAHVQAAENNIHMPLHGAFRDAKIQGDLFVAQAFYDQAQDVQFARA